MPKFKTKFSWAPYLAKKAERQRIKENRISYEKEMQERRRWAIKKSFNLDPYLTDWQKRKTKHQKFFEDFAIESLSLYDAADSANETLAQGLGLKATAIDLDSVEDLLYNIGMVKMAEAICSKSANLSKETHSKVMGRIIEQLFPPPVPQKPAPTSAKGDRIIEELLAIRAGRGQD